MSDHARNTVPMLASPRCGAKIRSGGSWPLAGGARKRRCRMHGGAPKSGAPKGNQNAAQARRSLGKRSRAKADQALLGEARKLLQEMK